MSRKSLLALGLVAAVLPGCEPWSKSFLRPKSSGASETSYIEDEELEDETAVRKSFFKNTRLSGALSSEAADIEKHLGVGR